MIKKFLMFHTKQMIQYMLFGLVALLTLYLSLEVKSYGFNQGWFSNDYLGYDGVILWFCIMMGIITPVVLILRKLFGRKDSIL